MAEELAIVIDLLSKVTDGAFWGFLIYIVYLVFVALSKLTFGLGLVYFLYKGVIKVFSPEVKVQV